MKSTPLLLIVAVVVGTVLRCYQASESLWLDELHTSWTVSGSLTEVYERAAIGNQSPLYFWLVWLFTFLPGPAEIVLRLPSLLAGCSLPVAVFWLTRKFVSAASDEEDDTAPLLAAWLTVVDPLAIAYSQEARPYALLMLLAVVHIGLLLNVLAQANWPARIAWIITGALLVHLHYTAGLLLVAEVVALAMISYAYAPAQRREFLLQRGMDLLLMCLLIVPALPGIATVAARKGNWETFVARPEALDLFSLFPWTIAAVVLIVANGWRQVVSQRSLIVLSCWLFVPLIVAWTATRFGWVAIFYPRYLLFAVPPTLVMAALCSSLTKNVNWQPAVIGVLLAIAVGNSGLIQNLRATGRPLPGRNEDWRAAVAELNEQLKTSPAPVLVRSGLIEADELPAREDSLFLQYCLLPVRGIYRANFADDQLFPLPTKNPGQLSAKARSALVAKGEAWLLIRTTSATKKQQLLAQIGESLGPKYRIETDEPKTWGGVFLQRVRVREK
ncbi:hypothetical protein ETAA8_29540 [Anatilimnocola aggregata]|uniref:Uncharacterized protein n=1 Tax=Anatilimnocola aggregata TaxID=2528021 RepID=A0A517YC93_9BACT|nr:glycosyltransferase family 39 protein [Anatilimnocola aggregata]QDU27863.1 hypothetical protein ETAA8_29540 [Anatilimnocola aggregata]